MAIKALVDLVLVHFRKRSVYTLRKPGEKRERDGSIKAISPMALRLGRIR